ncbi:MAG: hypothetical protein OEV64_04145 [Desulfobulbaceae bacterium]|nr:hypothetical protein [Desulfobulbaceae bacterium]
MKKIDEIITEIKRLEKELSHEIQKKEAEYYYKIQGKKIYFEQSVKKAQKKLSTTMASYIFHARFLHMITSPIIWLCLVPGFFLDGMVTIYQAICFPVYGIPKVMRKDYIVMDRQSLAYLNLIEKINCMYCGYFNGLIAYVQEIAARTEQYWCPIKHARKIRTIHSRYKMFFEYGDGEEFKKNLEKIRKQFDDVE